MRMPEPVIQRAYFACAAGGSEQFAPGTHQGRRLIAHELTHVAQQAGADGFVPAKTMESVVCPRFHSRCCSSANPKRVHRRKNPPKKQPPKKTLKSQGVDLSHPVAVGTATIIDEVLLRNQKLVPPSADRLYCRLQDRREGKIRLGFHRLGF